MERYQRPVARNLMLLTLGTLVAVRASMTFIDAAVARGVMRLLGKLPFLHRATADMPDLLLLLVCVSTGTLWGRYLFLLRRHGKREPQVRFLLLTGTAIPAAFLLKYLGKYIFGRVTTRSWLVTSESLGFHWFDGSGAYTGFPSGHMAVFTAGAAAVALSFPRYRVPAVSLLLLIGASLVATDYHFISDVIAGGYLGLAVTLMLHHLLPPTQDSSPAAPHP